MLEKKKVYNIPHTHHYIAQLHVHFSDHFMTLAFKPTVCAARRLRVPALPRLARQYARFPVCVPREA